MSTSERLAAALSDRYTIDRELGAGGMATVYLAEDLKHDRKVAIKVLKPELAAVLGAERFVQEIKTTAALSHPHILPLFDSGEAGGFLYYVMPFIEGETIREKLNRETQFGIEEAVRITTEVADALDYAHRHGVIHRDIKPENILLHDGRAMVMDFGIALAVSAAAGGRMTETGLSLGTPHYMSPEQATADKDLTNRSDIYSLGAVLYEMLAGDPPHIGSSAQQVIMKIVTDEARPVTELRKSVPGNVAEAVATALETLPADRFTTAAEFARALGDSSFRTASSIPATSPAGRNAWKAAAVVATLVAVAASGVAIMLATRTAPVRPPHRVSVALPEGQGLRDPWLGNSLTISADGEEFAYLGNDSGPSWQVWVRRRDQLEATPVEGTTSALEPALSPDGTELAFTTGGPGPLKVATLATGGIRTVVDSARYGGVAWGDDGNLYFVAENEGLARVHPDGGGFQQLTVPAGDTIHQRPWVLPGSRAAVFEIVATTTGPARIGVVDFASGKVHDLGPGASPMYLTTGDLAWITESRDLMAAPFALNRLEVTGPAVRLVTDISRDVFGAAHVAISRSGTLIYRRGPLKTLATPVWVARDGRAQPVARDGNVSVVPGAMGIALSPDGSRFVFPRASPPSVDLWVYDRTGRSSRFTFGEANARPTWTPDGKAIAFRSNRASRNSNAAAWIKPADGGGTAKLLLQSDRAIQDVTFSHDGEWLVYRLGSGADRDIYAIRPHVDSVGRPLLTSPFEERSPALSPNDHWMAYVSNEGGRDEVWVCSFPDATAAKWQVSTDGGTEPVWSRDGRELFYRDGNDDLVAVEVNTTSAFEFGQKQVLFSASPYYAERDHANYDVDVDGRGFLMLQIVPSVGGELILVDNWFSEVAALMRNGGVQNP